MKRRGGWGNKRYQQPICRLGAKTPHFGMQDIPQPRKKITEPVRHCPAIFMEITNIKNEELYFFETHCVAADAHFGSWTTSGQGWTVRTPNF